MRRFAEIPKRKFDFEKFTRERLKERARFRQTKKKDEQYNFESDSQGGAKGQAGFGE